MSETPLYPAPDPRVLECTYGDWLAVSPDVAVFHIGVMGDTREAAIRTFRDSWARWAAMWEGELPPPSAVSAPQDRRSRTRNEYWRGYWRGRADEHDGRYTGTDEIARLRVAARTG